MHTYHMCIHADMCEIMLGGSTWHTLASTPTCLFHGGDCTMSALDSQQGTWGIGDLGTHLLHAHQAQVSVVCMQASTCLSPNDL